MPFTATVEVQPYVPAPPPVLEGSLPLHYGRELKSIRRALDSLTRAVKELQDHLESLP